MSPLCVETDLKHRKCFLKCLLLAILLSTIQLGTNAVKWNYILCIASLYNIMVNHESHCWIHMVEMVACLAFKQTANALNAYLKFYVDIVKT